MRFVASALSAALGEWLDAIAIVAIVIINAVIGFLQEHRAERAVNHIPAPRAVFEIGPLSAADCVLTLLVASGPVTVIDVGKLVRRWNLRKTAS